ncbi:MAG: GYD domain-containing protein, partial [Gemmatimonadota bacterium]
MAKYLIQASYTADGVKGLMTDGGTKRREAASRLIESVGARMESFYFAFGDADAFVVVDAADHATV